VSVLKISRDCEPHSTVVVVDASLVATWVLSAPYRLQALAPVDELARSEIPAIAPGFMLAEVASSTQKVTDLLQDHQLLHMYLIL
jgi:hypothetical protein